MPATKNTPSTHHPRRRNVTTLMVGLKNRSHTQKSHPKVVNPRDIAGERKKKKKKKKGSIIIVIVSISIISIITIAASAAVVVIIVGDACGSCGSYVALSSPLLRPSSLLSLVLPPATTSSPSLMLH